MAWRSETTSRGCLGLLCGLPGTGKSTIAAQIQCHAAADGCCVYLVTYDKLIPVDVESQLIQQSAEQGVSQWKSARSQVLACVDCLINRLSQFDPHNNSTKFDLPAPSYVYETEADKTDSLSSGEQENRLQLAKPSNVDVMLWQRFLSAVDDSDCASSSRDCVVDGRCEYWKSWLILIDDNMHYSSMRYEYCQLARRYEIGFCVLHLYSPVEVALERNRMRQENRVADHVITSMHERFETPDTVKRQWEKYNLTVSGETTADLHLIFEMVKQAMSDPQHMQIEEDSEEKESSRFICSTNTIHQADQILRKCISQSMARAKDAGSSREQLTRLASALSQHRTSILGGMRKGEISLPFDPGVDSGITDASKEPSSRLFQFVEQLFLTRCRDTS